MLLEVGQKVRDEWLMKPYNLGCECRLIEISDIGPMRTVVWVPKREGGGSEESRRRQLNRVGQQ